MEAAEVLGADTAGGPVLITCEHASQRVPPPLRPSAADRRWLRTHWGWDIGIATVARAVARLLGAPAVLARFSRLVCDANRGVDDPTWIRTEVEGHPLDFNRPLDDAERARRRAACYAPFHDAVAAALDRRLARGGPFFILSLHSFTPVFEGRRREMEMGVLHDGFEERAETLRRGLAAAGFAVALNLPYTGFSEVIYSPRAHGRARRLPYLELEVRQDLIDRAGKGREVARRIAAVLAAP